MVLSFLRDESGATAIEYGMLAALVALGAIAAVTLTGGGLQNLFGYINNTAGESLSNAAGYL